MLESGKKADGTPLTVKDKELLRMRIYALNSRREKKLMVIKLKEDNEKFRRKFGCLIKILNEEISEQSKKNVQEGI